jgi:hypothetical protein
MPISESDVRAFVTKACAVVSGHGLDYLTVCVPSSRSNKSFVEHAKVMGDRSAEEIASETWGHIEDIISSAVNEGKSEALIRIFLYRAKAPGGSRTFRTDLAPNSYQEDSEDSGNTSLAAALVSTNRELRLALKDSLEIVQQNAGAGWKLLAESMKAEREARNEANDLKILLAVNDSESKPDAMKELTVKVAGDFIDVMKTKAMIEMQKEAEKK